MSRLCCADDGAGASPSARTEPGIGASKKSRVLQGDFRAKLVEAEETVAPLPEDDRNQALMDIRFAALAQKVADLMPTYGGLAAELAAGAVLDVIPWAGTLHSAVSGVAKVRKERSDWMAVFIALRDL